MIDAIKRIRNRQDFYYESQPLPDDEPTRGIHLSGNLLDPEDGEYEISGAYYADRFWCHASACTCGEAHASLTIRSVLWLDAYNAGKTDLAIEHGKTWLRVTVPFIEVGIGRDRR